jgi:integrase
MPKRANNEGTIRLRADGSWEARIFMGRDPATGKPIRKSVYGKTQKEVLQKMTQMRAQMGEGTYIEPSKLTVGAWLDIWHAEYAKNAVKASTHHNYSKCIRSYLKPNLAAVGLSKLNTHTVQTMINKLNVNISAKTIKNAHGVLHRALQQAVLLGYIKANPADNCELPRQVKFKYDVLDAAHIPKFLEAIKGDEYEAFYFVTLFTGMRQSEAIGLRWQCVDFAKGTITVNAQLVRDYAAKGYRFDETTKNDKARIITAAPEVLETLVSVREKQSEWKASHADIWADGDLVFTNEIGEHLKHPTVARRVKNIMVQIGLPGARFHDLRHSYAYAALMAGDHVKTVQETMGHHSAAFTLDQYGHVTEDMKRESASRMSAFIKNVS